MKLNEVRKRYLDLLKESGHVIVPSARIIPENDPTTLFTGSGMQPMVPYLLGETHPEGTRIADSQKCFRAEDIEEVGNTRHTTFFEMLGNWSLGDYFKKEQLKSFWFFLTDSKKGLGIDPKRLYMTTFSGDPENQIPKDDEAVDIWKEIFAEAGLEVEAVDIGSEQAGYERGMNDGERIFAYEASKNWWSRAGVPNNMPVGEPGGPDSETFFDTGAPHDPVWGKHCHPNCDCGRFIEIGNSVFMEYVKTENGFEKLPQQNVDFGGGLGRMTMAANDLDDVFKVDAFQVVVKKLEELSGKSYEDTDYQIAFRVVTDHVRGAIFMIADGITPSNGEQGYFVRRLLRRAVFYADKLGVPQGSLKDVVAPVVQYYSDGYPELSTNLDQIVREISEEESKFRQTLETGLRQFEKLAFDQSKISGQDAFILFSTYGFPFELTHELAIDRGIEIDEEGYKKAFEGHKDASRAGADQKFKGGLADHSEISVRYHTATHLLNAALRQVLGDHVIQRGSNITGERLRFDFPHETKMTDEEKQKTVALVNEWIDAKLPVTWSEMTIEEANAAGAMGAFGERYPDRVKVYTVGEGDSVVSREICGGPHVENTSELAQSGIFKIKKEESSSAGIRRIKGILS